MTDNGPRDLIGRGRFLAPAVTVDELEQWATLCSVAGEDGICMRPAVDPTAPIKLCRQHLAMAIALGIARLDAMIADPNVNLGGERRPDVVSTGTMPVRCELCGGNGERLEGGSMIRCDQCGGTGVLPAEGGNDHGAGH